MNSQQEISKAAEQHWDLVIEAGRAEKNYWKDLWRYRELFYILSWRDLKVRYKQTAVGAAWSIIRPLLTTVILTIVFSRIAHVSYAGSAPYALMVFAGMLPWQFFSNALSESSGSLIGNANLVTKVYFPRMIIPASSVITSLADLAISFGIMLCLCAWYGYMPSWHTVFLPLFILLAFAAAFGTGLYLTALNVKYRDFRFIIPFIVQFGLYVSPVGFPSSTIPAKWKVFYYLNPMAGVIDGFRWSLLGDEIAWRYFVESAAVTVLFLLIGIGYFRKVERTFADNI
jgi:lipopolysaccharide transport system permease protein